MQDGDRLAREMIAHYLVQADNEFGRAVTLRAIDAAIARLDAEAHDPVRIWKAADILVRVAEVLGGKISATDRDR